VPFAGTSPYRELCFHVLAHVPMAGPGSLFDRRYLVWVDAAEPPDQRAMTIADGRIIAQALASDRARDTVQLLPELHDSFERFMATRRRALADLKPSDVTRPDVLAALQRADSPAFELLHATLGLAADAHAARWEEAIGPALDVAAEDLAQLGRDAGAIAEPLAELEVELAWALGPRGRAYPEHIVVGAPAAWHHGAAETALVVALHEHHVRDRAAGDWAAREWSGLRSLARAMNDAPEWLQAAHADWLAALDLAELAASNVAAQRMNDATARALAEQPLRRAELLRGV
jgi:hypothetical protein